MNPLAQMAVGRFLIRAQNSYLWRNGFYHRKRYAARMERIPQNKLEWAPPVDVVVYSYVSDHDVPEQMVSLRTFLRFVGVPKEFVIVSDGTISPRNRELLEANHPCVKCTDGAELETALGEEFLAPFRHALEGNCFWKKFQIIAYLSQLDGVGVYTDSDILFFPGALQTPNFCHFGQGENYYLPDLPNFEGHFFDQQLIYEESERKEAINAGFVVLGKKTDWSQVAKRAANYQGEANHYTEQTMVHLMTKQNGAKPLDSDTHVLSFADTESWKDVALENPRTVLRHYVRVSRHRFWRHKPDFYR